MLLTWLMTVDHYHRHPVVRHFLRVASKHGKSYWCANRHPRTIRVSFCFFHLFLRISDHYCTSPSFRRFSSWATPCWSPAYSVLDLHPSPDKSHRISSSKHWVLSSRRHQIFWNSRQGTLSKTVCQPTLSVCHWILLGFSDTRLWSWRRGYHCIWCWQCRCLGKL